MFLISRISFHPGEKIQRNIGKTQISKLYKYVNNVIWITKGVITMDGYDVMEEIKIVMASLFSPLIETGIQGIQII